MAKRLNSKELSTKEMELMFDVTNRTVVNWRIGSPRITKLPFHEDPRPLRSRIYFLWPEVKKWAKENGITVVHNMICIRRLRKRGYRLED